jgi:NhaP-type Na+/H+ or K+/H+ antiporter
MAVMAPKGLAAAVLVSLPLQQGVPGGDLIQSSAYAVVLFSIVLTSILVFMQDKTVLGKFYRTIFSGFGSRSLTTAAAPGVAAVKPEDLGSGI